MNPALKSFVKCLNTIGCQEEDALVVLRQTQEDRHEAVTMDIVGLTRFEEDICFIKEKDSAPGVRNIHDAIEIRLE